MPHGIDQADRLSTQPEIFEIRVGGHLKDIWSERFKGMSITRNNDGSTTLRGPLVDQTALHSILLKIRDMNLKLISVRCIQID